MAEAVVREYAEMLFGTKCENFLCAQLWNKVRVFMVLNKNSAVSVVSGKVFLLLFRSPRTRRLFLSQLIKSTNYRKFKSKHIRNSTFCSPLSVPAPEPPSPGRAEYVGANVSVSQMRLCNRVRVFSPEHAPRDLSAPEARRNVGSANVGFLMCLLLNLR